MRMLTLVLVASTALALGAGAAEAQSWTTINDRQERLDGRIEAGIRSGDLTRGEAVRLRGDFNVLADLEHR